MQERPLRKGHVDDVVEAVVEEDLGVEHHDHVDPDEHLEHPLVEVEVHRAGGLGRRAGPVEEGVLALPPHGQLEPERPVAAAVVVDEVVEGLRLLGEVLDDELSHRPLGPLEEGGARAGVDVGAEPLADLDDPPLPGPAARDDRHEIAQVHLRRAGVVHDDVEGGAVELASLVDLDWRDPESFAVDRGRGGRHAARDRAADVHHVAEHRAEADELPLVEDGQEHHPVVDVADRAAALVGVALEDDVPRGELERLLGEHLRDVGAELPDDHAARGVGDHGELVVLLADDRRHRGAEQHRVHLVARVAKGVLDEVEGDGIEGGVGGAPGPGAPRRDRSGRRRRGPEAIGGDRGSRPGRRPVPVRGTAGGGGGGSVPGRGSFPSRRRGVADGRARPVAVRRSAVSGVLEEPVELVAARSEHLVERGGPSRFV